ncbi:hypothetical protein MRB53_041355 [Persea americana]|nr:hypothetical protein MRB53_041355 [Persea americana]
MSGLFERFSTGEVNFSIASLPFTLLLAALPHWYTIYISEKHKLQGGWTNENPRAFVARLNAQAAAGKKLSALESTVLRGQAAQQNGFEWWAVWAVAVRRVQPALRLDDHEIQVVPAHGRVPSQHLSSRRHLRQGCLDPQLQIGVGAVRRTGLLCVANAGLACTGESLV